MVNVCYILRAKKKKQQEQRTKKKKTAQKRIENNGKCDALLDEKSNKVEIVIVYLFFKLAQNELIYINSVYFV